MTPWIAYSIGVALLLGAAAWAAEAAPRSLGRPARGVWLAALAASALLPAYAAVGGPLPALLPFPSPPFAEPAALALAAASPGTIAPVPSRLPAISWFPLAWALASAALLGLLLLLEVRLRRERRGWLESAVDGARVLVSRDVGPAVAGLLRGRIVLPAWALRLDGPVVRAIVAHEAEHVRAGDPRVLLTGLLAVCALPWNPVLWWQYRRLALAVELDCDARVLAMLRDPRAYGLALLETARRRSRGVLLHAALLRPRSFLQRRIEMLGRWNGRRLTARALACAGIAAIALVAAVCAETPMASEDADTLASQDPPSDLRPRGQSALRSELEFVDRAEMSRETLMEMLNSASVAELRDRLNTMLIPYTMGADAQSVRIDRVRLTPTLFLEASELRYVRTPEPRWLVVSAVMRHVDAGDHRWTLRADTVWLEP